MKWLTVASLVGAAWAVTAFVLSLVFGSALPISALVLGLAVAPSLVIGFAALRGTNHDSTYRTLHRFSTAAKCLLLLYILLGTAGLVVTVGFAADMPQSARFDPHPRLLSAAEHYATLVDPFRITAGIVLLVYAAVGVLVLIRMHYRPPVVRR
jgi:hypothetical protein